MREQEAATHQSSAGITSVFYVYRIARGDVDHSFVLLRVEEGFAVSNVGAKKGPLSIRAFRRLDFQKKTSE
jgi:hypothetical protein